MNIREFKNKLQEYIEASRGHLALEIGTVEDSFGIAWVIGDNLHGELCLCHDSATDSVYSIHGLLVQVEEIAMDDNTPVYYCGSVSCDTIDLLHAQKGHVLCYNLTDDWHVETMTDYESEKEHEFVVCETDHEHGLYLNLYNHRALVESEIDEIGEDEWENIEEPDIDDLDLQFPPLYKLPWTNLHIPIAPEQVALLQDKCRITIESDGHFEGTLVDVTGEFLYQNDDDEYRLDMDAAVKCLYQRTLALSQQSDINGYFEKFCIGSMRAEYGKERVKVFITIDS